MYIVVCELWGGCDDCQIFGASCCYVDSQRRKEAHYSQAVTVHKHALAGVFYCTDGGGHSKIISRRHRLKASCTEASTACSAVTDTVLAVQFQHLFCTTLRVIACVHAVQFASSI